MRKPVHTCSSKTLISTTQSFRRPGQAKSPIHLAAPGQAGWTLALALVSGACSSEVYHTAGVDAGIGHDSGIAPAAEIPVCVPSCQPGTVCMNTFTADGAQCSPIPPEAPFADFVLPFDSQTEVVCTHSSGSGSHSGANAYYALDLANAYDQPAAVVHAAADGEAFVYLGEDGQLCPEPPGTPKQADPSTCGLSWGNRVKLMHGNGYFSYYVHLDHPLVKTGDMVKKGDALGVEGWTGAAGHRHLHFSIQKLPGQSEADWRSEIPTYAGQSVPFQFSAVQHGTVQKFSVADVHCAHANIGEAPPSQQPRFQGVP